MAAALTVEEVADALATCDICQELFNEDSRAPLLLEPCRHVFCRCCITSLVKEGSIQCPKCRQDVRLGEFGVAGLAKDFVTMNNVDFVSMKKKMMSSGISCTDCFDGAVATHRCQSCRTYMCTTCHDAHYRTARTRSHRVVELRVFMESVESFLQENDPCPRHRDKQIEFYCKKCETCLCMACTVVGHQNHNIVHLEEVFQEHLEESKKLRTLVNGRTAFLSDEKTRVCRLLRYCHIPAQRVKEEIKAHFTKIRSSLMKREEELLKSCDRRVTMYQMEMDGYIQAVSALEISLKEITKHLQKAEQMTRPSEFIGLQQKQAQTVRKMVFNPKPPSPVPHGLQFSPVGLSTIRDGVEKLGRIQDSTTPSTYQPFSEKIRKELVHLRGRTYALPESGEVFDCKLSSERVLLIRQYDKSGNDVPLSCIRCSSFRLSKEKLNTGRCYLSDPSTLEALPVSQRGEGGTQFVNYPGTIGSITLRPHSSNYFECHLEIKLLKKLNRTRSCAEIALAPADSGDERHCVCERQGWGIRVSTCSTHPRRLCVHGLFENYCLRDCSMARFAFHHSPEPTVIQLGFLVSGEELTVFDVKDLSLLCKIPYSCDEVVPWFSLGNPSCFAARMHVKTGDSLQMDAAKVRMLVEKHMEPDFVVYNPFQDPDDYTSESEDSS